jgi:hypothetical protein
VKDKWYFGGSLSIPFLRYTRDASFKESDASGNNNNGFNYFIANENLQTKGVGISGKFGVIFKPTEAFRVGLSFFIRPLIFS